MDEPFVRALVRDAIARHLPDAVRLPAPPGAAGGPVGHTSHALYVRLQNATEACLIEPAVPCDHCGYCKSHGH